MRTENVRVCDVNCTSIQCTKDTEEFVVRSS